MGAVMTVVFYHISDMGKAIEDDSINFPKPEHFRGCYVSLLPYFLVGDEAFSLKPWLERPYPGKSLTECKRIFYYRLSRARRVIKNTFGILRARWRSNFCIFWHCRAYNSSKCLSPQLPEANWDSFVLSIWIFRQYGPNRKHKAWGMEKCGVWLRHRCPGWVK